MKTQSTSTAAKRETRISGASAELRRAFWSKVWQAFCAGTCGCAW